MESVPLLSEDTRSTREQSTEKSDSVHLYSAATGYCFTANYIIGVGLLGVPNAFAKAGLVFSPLILLFGSLLSALTIVWIIESIARSQALKKYAGHTSDVSAEDPTLFKIGTTKMEINELLGQFVGNWAKTAFTVLLGAFIYITLWSYSAVFSSSLVSLVPFPGVSMGYVCDIYSPIFPAPCERSYLLYMLLFLLIVSPLICMDLTEQVGLQIFLCIFRFGAILIMFVTSVIAMYHTPYSRNDQGSPPYISFRTAVDLSGFGTIFPTAIFSQLLHHSIPGLVQPVKQKGWVRSMFSAALTTTFSLYLALGIPAVMYFGNGVKPVISLNWKDYSGLGFDGPEQAPVIAKIISYIVVLFPVLDIVSAFPLNGITLANTMFASLPAKFTNNGTSQWVKIATRLVVVFPPIILGSFVKRLDLIIEIAGTVGFFIAFIVPALLQIFSVRRARTYLGRTDTPYSIPLLSHPILAVLVAIFGIGSFIFQCVNIGMRIHDGSLKM